ncbi:hypothetical protein ACLOJK_032878 [Asimina triloba]
MADINPAVYTRSASDSPRTFKALRQSIKSSFSNKDPALLRIFGSLFLTSAGFQRTAKGQEFHNPLDHLLLLSLPGSADTPFTSSSNRNYSVRGSSQILDPGHSLAEEFLLSAQAIINLKAVGNHALSDRDTQLFSHQGAIWFALPLAGMGILATMSSNVDSSTTNDDLNGRAHLKRDSNSSDEDLVSKRSRISASSFENAEKDAKNLSRHTSETTASFADANCHNGTDIQLHVSKDNPTCENSSLVEDKIIIEADAAEDKGSRHTMEDAWVILPDASMEFPGKLRCSHFAIYDGHGGRLAADYARNHLHANVLSAGLPRELMDIKTAKKAILEGFQKTDELLLQESIAGRDRGAGKMVFVANVGDAKAVLGRLSTVNGDETNSQLKSIVITREHKAIYPQERARIQKAGGSVGSNGRLQGRLEVSRAFGDRQFKKVGVIATPDVHSFDLTEKEKFVILGCDGLWGVFGPSDAVEFVDKQLKGGLSATAVSRRLVKEAVRERRCKDNCTAIVIVFKHN